MTLDFLGLDNEAHNPLEPITPLRLAFLIKRALSEVPSAVAPEAAVYDEIWERRGELADQSATTLQMYRKGREEFLRFRRTSGSIERVGRILQVVAGLALVFVILRDTLLSHSRVYGGLALSVAIGAAGIVLGFLLTRVARRRLRYAGERSDAMYRRLIGGELNEEISGMIDEIVHRDDERVKGALLHRMRAPSLVEFESQAVVQSESFEEVLALVNGHVTSAVGVAGTRGAGKTTLLRLLCLGAESDGEPLQRIGVYLPAPVSLAEGDFVKVIYSTTVRQVIASRGLDRDEARDARPWHRSRSDIAWAREALNAITGTRSHQRTRKLGLSLLRFGMSAERTGQTTWTERDPSRADWAAEFRGYVAGHRVRNGRPILIAIDELDKIADAEQVIEIINDIKDLFHVRGVHFVVSVSDDALHRFATRGIPLRDAFDTAFDAMIEVRRLTAEESCDLLRQRARRFPYSAALFCHAWSGGLPRDLVRTARSCVTIQNRHQTPTAVAQLVHKIVRRDVGNVVDAMIKRERDAVSAADVEALLVLRRLIDDNDSPPHAQLIPFLTDSEYDSEHPLASLAIFLDIAIAISQYYSIARDSEHWAEGVRSGELLRHAARLAEAKAALGVHPSEAAWRLRRAREEIGLP